VNTIVFIVILLICERNGLTQHWLMIAIYSTFTCSQKVNWNLNLSLNLNVNLNLNFESLLHGRCWIVTTIVEWFWNVDVNVDAVFYSIQVRLLFTTWSDQWLWQMTTNMTKRNIPILNSRDGRMTDEGRWPSVPPDPLQTTLMLENEPRR